MRYASRDGISLAYTDHEPSDASGPGLVLVHGWCCTHTIFDQLSERLPGRRLVSVDLRGHGASDRPTGDYTVASFAADVAWLIERLALKQPVVVGHSMGGNIGLEVAAGRPDLTSGVVMIDSVLLPDEALLDMTTTMAQALAGGDYERTFRAGVSVLFSDMDDPARCDALIEQMLQTDRSVARSAFAHHLTRLYTPEAALKSCTLPLAHVAASKPMIDLARVRALRPNLISAQTLGSGHFSLLEVPDQIAAMIERFILVTASSRKP